MAAMAAMLLLLGELRAGPSPVTLLTIAQRDRLRSAASPPSASVSGDGRFVAFASYERLSPADTDNLADIYVLEHATGTVTLESVDVSGFAIQADCLYPRLSGSGRYLVYETALLRASGEPRFMDVIFRDRAAGSSRRVTVGVAGQDADGWSANASISDDGTIVVFESTATNLVAGTDANGTASDVYRVHTATMQTTRISVDDRGEQSSAGASLSPTLSGDGRHVAFVSSAPLVGGPPRGDARNAIDRRPSRALYLRDLVLGSTRRVDRGTSAIASGDIAGRPALSRDGSLLAFASAAANIVDGDDNRSADVFVADTATGAITLVSRNPAGRPANGASGSPSISGNGRFIAFQSNASNLLCTQKCEPHAEDINLVPDVFLFDRTTSRVAWVSVGTAGGWMEESVAPAIDSAGRVLAFTSRHPIDERDTGHDFDLFVRIASGL
jgi:Tol biopolymer transport system component